MLLIRLVVVEEIVLMITTVVLTTTVRTNIYSSIPWPRHLFFVSNFATFEFMVHAFSFLGSPSPFSDSLPTSSEINAGKGLAAEKVSNQLNSSQKQKS